MALPMYCYDCKAAVPAGKPVCLACGQDPAIAPGTVLNGAAGSYTIDSVLGKGGMGLAYKATDSSGREVVVKQMFEDSDPAIHAENLKRFMREASIQQSIISPRFPAGYGYFFQDGIHFMAMEFIPGQDLIKVLGALPNSRLPEDEVLQIGIQVAEGIITMHELTDAMGIPMPILHRDIKPDNIVQKPNKEVVILDFGIARPEIQTAATAARLTSVGTIEYCAMEQLLGSAVKQSDLYSIAATMFRLVTGVTLPDVYDLRPAEVNKLPLAWRSVFQRALDNDARMRQADVREFHDDLRSLLPANLRSSVPVMVQTVGASSGARTQFNLTPLLQNLGWIFVGLLLAVAVVAYIFTKPLIWKSALGVLVVVALVKIVRGIAGHFPGNWWRRNFSNMAQQLKRPFSWLKGLNLPIASWASLLVLLAAVIMLFIAVKHDWRNMGWLAVLGGLFAVSAIRFFSSKPRRFLSRMGMAVFGSSLLVWAMFHFGS